MRLFFEDYPLAVKPPGWHNAGMLTLWRRLVSGLKKTVAKETSHLTFQHRLFLFGQLCVAITCFYFWHNPPLPGWAVALLAAAAAAMSIHAHMRPWQKAFWMVLIGALLVIELQAISKDRTDSEKNALKDRLAQDLLFKGVRDAQNADFKETAKGLERAIANSNAAITGTEKAFQMSKEAADNATGGNSFVYIKFNPRSQFITAFKRGNAPIYDLNLQVSSWYPVDGFDQNELRRSDAIEMYTLNYVPVGEGPVNRNLDLFRADGKPNGKFALDKDRAYILVFFQALNGSWTEVEWLRRNPRAADANTPWLYAIRLYKFESPKVPKKLIFEEMSPDFPTDALKEHSP